MPGVRKGLSRSRVVVAALAIVDRDGPEGLTMRALGRELGVDPMAVYHYVPGKSALYDALAEAVWAEVELPARTGEWEADLVALARGVRRALLAHPRALPVVATRQSVAPATLDLLETGIAILVEAGLPPAVALSLMGAASAEASSPSCPSVALRCPAGPDGESRGQQRRSRGSVVRLEELAKGTRVRGISAAGW